MATISMWTTTRFYQSIGFRLTTSESPKAVKLRWKVDTSDLMGNTASVRQLLAEQSSKV